MKKMYYTYILQSSRNGRYYIGSTANVFKRLEAHNAGRNKSTKHYKPWRIVRMEEYKSLTEARRRENNIKSKKSRKIIEMIIADKETGIDLKQSAIGTPNPALRDFGERAKGKT